MNPSALTPEQISVIRRRWTAGDHIKAIATQLGMTVAQVYGAAHRLGLRRSRGGTRATVEGLGLRPEMTLQQVADAMGCTREHVRQIEVSALRKLRRNPLAWALFEQAADLRAPLHALAEIAEEGER